MATYALPPAAARSGRERALDLFPELGVRLAAPARTLSGGEQQMLVLAQACVRAALCAHRRAVPGAGAGGA